MNSTAIPLPAVDSPEPTPSTAPGAYSRVCTEDGTWIVVHPKVGAISGRSLSEIEAELRRLVPA